MWPQTGPIPILLFLSLVSFSASSDTLKPPDTLSVNQTLVSDGGFYELGFFPSGNYYYLGIWYYKLQPRTVVWVANRDSRPWGSAVSVSLASDGRITLSEQGRSEFVLATNNHSSQAAVTNPVLQILNTGNLVVWQDGEAPTGGYFWQSFDHPTGTLLPGQKLGWDNKTGEDRYITSWKSSSDPSSGNYSFRLFRTGDPEIFLLRDGKDKLYRSGPWVGQRFSGVPEMKPSTALNFSFHDDNSSTGVIGLYYTFDLVDPTIKSRLMVDPSGKLNRFTWVPDRAMWNLFWYAPKDECDKYAECGPYGVCDAGSLLPCGCPQGFEPKNPSAWRLRDGSDGCVRKTRLDCGSDGFAVLREMKLPESGAATVYADKDLQECGEMCKRDCDCTAYASKTVVYGAASGCVMWTGDLVDMRNYTQGGQDLYIRVAASDLIVSGNGSLDSGSSRTKKVLIGVGVSAGILVLALVGLFRWNRKRRRAISSMIKVDQSRRRTTQRSQDLLLSKATGIPNKRELSSTENDADDLELPLYDFDAMLVATDCFSEENKLGEGGFGRVYKGVLVEGEEVAVKRLSKDSGQGVEEFKNEVKLIAKLQHRNLVRLLGCCVDRDEKMLLYEYLPNRSLDSVLFHKERREMLHWQRRSSIILGIARGLLYLHHDSRLRIIHRDLKASNILLDSEMQPKISDFGMARIFGGDETELNNTRRVVGTYGYMAPEYAMDGLFSIKSDVFSFGVLVLEIVTGTKNKGFYNSNQDLTLLGHAWKTWKEGKGAELLDPSMGDSYSRHEVERCIQVGLLCVQERPEERPTMSQVILLLSSESASLPLPKRPGFCLGWRPEVTDSSSSRHDETFTVNQVTVTMMDGR